MINEQNSGTPSKENEDGLLSVSKEKEKSKNYSMIPVDPNCKCNHVHNIDDMGKEFNSVYCNLQGYLYGAVCKNAALKWYIRRGRI